MTFLEIEAFLKITETGSFSAAAEALYVTQPALGRRIRAMEEELGYPLFVRGKGLRKVELTRQGHAFIGIAHRWQALWNETREAALLAPSRNFYVASVGSLLAFMLPTVFRTFMKENPECSLHVSTLHSSEAYSYVGNRSVDIAFITDPIYSSSVGTHILFKEKLCLVAGKELVIEGGPYVLCDGNAKGCGSGHGCMRRCCGMRQEGKAPAETQNAQAKNIT